MKYAKRMGNGMHCHVAPHAGAWIEMVVRERKRHGYRSLPMRERGLKSERGGQAVGLMTVAPHAGAWIEILQRQVAQPTYVVAPHAGAWIEMMKQKGCITVLACRSPCGSVD